MKFGLLVVVLFGLPAIASAELDLQKEIHCTLEEGQKVLLQDPVSGGTGTALDSRYPGKVLRLTVYRLSQDEAMLVGDLGSRTALPAFSLKLPLGTQQETTRLEGNNEVHYTFVAGELEHITLSGKSRQTARCLQPAR